MIGIVTRPSRLAIAAMLTALGAGVCQAQAPPRRLVWHGTEILEDAYNFGGRVRPAIGTPAEYHHRIVINFTYVEELDERGRAKLVSKKISWTADGRSAAPGYENVACSGSGGGELVGASGAAATEMLKIPCSVARESNFFGFFQRPPSTIKPPALIARDKLRDDCSYSEETPGRRYSVWLTGDFDAVIDVDTTAGPYAAFSPAPGRVLTFTARTVPAMPALFKFVLDRDEVSHFPGYTSNARVTDAMLERVGLPHLKGKYADDGPDWLFDEKEFRDHDRWGSVAPDAVETAAEDSAATVTVTAMDYGAVGKLRAFVKVKCGGWQPVRIHVNGQDRDAIDMPMDEDHNLIADSMQAYRGDPAADSDAEPAGKGLPGDGLTNFEEYRGFATAGGDCASEADDVVVRTDPGRKDLFVHAPDPELAGAIHFEWASGVTTHQICARQFVDPDRRIVNFTLQQADLREWHGRTISQASPQHGLYIKNEWPKDRWGDGLACGNPPACDSDVIGPPKYTASILIDKPKVLGGNLDYGDVTAAASGVVRLISTVTHETGHGVGMPHHGDEVVDWQIKSHHLNIVAAFYKGDMVVEPNPGCTDPRQGGARQAPPVYDGHGKLTGCLTTSVRVRSGQNSGAADCPMRYPEGMFYEAPGETAVAHQFPEPDAWVMVFGRVLPYDTPDPPPIGKFCVGAAGTGINDKARGDRSHTGDAAVGNCAGQIVINDLAAPDRK